MPPDPEQEIIRLRERTHTITSDLRGFELRLTAVEGDLANVQREGEKYFPLIEQMSKADEIAEAVIAAQSKRGLVLPLGWVAKVVGAVAALAVIAGAIKGLIG